MALPTTETVECDILVVGGGMSGCGAAFEAAFWGRGLRVVIAEKAVIERSGATGEGLSAINCYMGQRYGWNTPEDFVRYVVNDMMGLAREDLVYDVGRHVDSSVHLLEEWGLPIWKKDNGEYERIGRWQIPIHGESIKPVAAEPARNALGVENIYERVAITHLLTDENDPNRIAGAIGFAVRENKFYVFKARAVIVTSGGASNVFRPRSVNEGLGPHLVLGVCHRLSLRVDDSRRGGNDPDGTPFRSHPVQGRLRPGGYVVPVFPRAGHQRPGRRLHRYPRRRTGQVPPLWPGRSHSHAAAQPSDVPGHPGRPWPHVYAHRRGHAKAVRGRPRQDGTGAQRSLGGLSGHDHRPGVDLGLPEHRPGGHTLGGSAG